MSNSYDPLYDDLGLEESLSEGELSFEERLEEAMGGLNDVQKEAVSEKEGAVLVLAGAGSGKTKVLTTRLALLIAGGMWASRMMAVTFTNKAAGEMKKRVGVLVGEEEASRIWIGTFHGLSLRILRVHGEKLGFGHDFTILSQDDSFRLMKTIMKTLHIDMKQISPKSILWRIEGWKNRGLGYEEAMEAQRGGRLSEEKERDGEGVSDDLVLSLYEHYQDQLQEADAMDFGDLLLHCLRLFRDHEEVLDNYAEKFRSVSVDEYQDSNPAQRAWILAFASHHGHLFCVGDEDQSIYGWRGATIDNILKFRQDFTDAKVIRLEQNYRSTGSVLKVASGLISHNRERYDKTLWTEGEEGDRVEVRAYRDGREEATGVAQSIEEGVGDSAILIRAGYQTRPFEEALTRLNIPYRIVGGVRFYERLEVRDLVAYLRFVSKPYDRMAFGRIINTPSRGIGPASLQKIQDVADEVSEKFMEVLEKLYKTPEESDDFFQSPTGKKGILKSNIVSFLDQVYGWREASEKMSPPELLEMIVKESGYREMVHRENDPLTRDTRIENIEALKGVLSDFPSLAAFLDHISLVLDTEESDVLEEDKVSIMTIHSAKGLEFDKVYLPCWEADSFPNRRAILEKAEKGLEEERRLAYVALTRAKKKVHVSYAHERFVHGSFTKSLPSCFIAELPEGSCDYVDMVPPSSLPSSSSSPSVSRGSASSHFEEGTRCRHRRYGEGAVESVNRDVITVEFDNPDVGRKVIISRFLSGV